LLSFLGSAFVSASAKNEKATHKIDKKHLYLCMLAKHTQF